MPLPPAYAALRSVSPVSSPSDGMPVTATVSLNATVMLIAEPAPYVPFASGEVTLRTAGAVVSAGSLPPSPPLPSPPLPSPPLPSGASPTAKNALKRYV